MSETVEVKTCDLEGPALDWAVAVIEGYDLMKHPFRRAFIPNFGYCDYSPSTNWNFGGPLIEKYKLDIGAPMENIPGPWNANTEWGHPMGTPGPTALIAACRAIVREWLGEIVSVPAELIK
ncbi:TPA: DUF2591 family protein [Pseudomonas aeruginosa]|uniref:phage protein NinX family protein n=1 Tax=Pseudomonas aeruginosa TaxID=287 RepID=UPI00071BD09A|nr:phage protein NinX family protein [Pseudomonas aeruginosa]KSC12396.1 hypothetical protein AO886_26700 [Pseudomonas aeruginosa]MBG5429512.1 DUF2591 family protein [Pseudomonas aeruginosa]MDG9823058.1 DUF2591 domain-containing protein [Pseudomonas aeruginosa]MDG9937669.1 DUF2591 domain-containing protein [Pseudomonas aeruginosa]MDH0529376.1 DUF2591 domain-containing protein [Pseudomonas aeruginosa]